MPKLERLPIPALIVSVLLAASPARANEGSSVGPNAIFFSGALKVGYGSISTPDGTTIPKTKHAAYSMDLGLGLRYGIWIVGVAGEYALWRQLTDPKKVSDVNAQGTLQGAYPLFGLEWDVLRILWKVPVAILGNYKFANVGVGGKKATYEDPKTLAIQLHWRTSQFSFWGVEYQKILFRNANIVGVDQNIAEKENMDLKAISLMYGWNF